MTAAVPDPREGIDWSKHRGSCRVFYAERRCTCGAVPDPRFRDQLAEALCPWSIVANCRKHNNCQKRADALLPLIAAEVEARVQAAAKQGAVERRWASETAWIEGYEACRRGDQLFRNPYRAAALVSPAPARHAEEEGEYTGPCRFCRHPAGKHDVDAECWIEGCACGTGESGDPASAPRAEEGQR